MELEERSRSLIAAAREELEHVAAVVHRSGMVVLLADKAQQSCARRVTPGRSVRDWAWRRDREWILSEVRPAPTPSAWR